MTAKGKMREMSTLHDATTSFYEALNLVLKGDAEPMLNLWSQAADVTYMSPLGELLIGWAPIEASWRDQAANLRGGPIIPEAVHVIEASEMGIVANFERGSVVINAESVPVDIRATSVYRREGNRWLMVGHHTDRL